LRDRGPRARGDGGPGPLASRLAHHAGSHADPARPLAADPGVGVGVRRVGLQLAGARLARGRSDRRTRLPRVTGHGPAGLGRRGVAGPARRLRLRVPRAPGPARMIGSFAELLRRAWRNPSGRFGLLALLVLGLAALLAPFVFQDPAAMPDVVAGATAPTLAH